MLGASEALPMGEGAYYHRHQLREEGGGRREEGIRGWGFTRQMGLK